MNPHNKQNIHYASCGCTGLRRPVRFLSKLGIMLGLPLLLATTALAQQTVVINPQTLNYWAGANTTNVLGVGSNSVAMTGADGVAMVNLTVTGQPTGLTTVLSTNSFTNSVPLGLFLRATNVTAGAYPLTLGASGAASYSTNVNFYVVPLWSQTNGASIGNWSDATKWSGGVVPGSSDGVYFEHLIPAAFTNVVDTSRTIQSLVCLGDGDDQGLQATAMSTILTNGSILSVIGTNGLYIGRKSVGSSRPVFTFSGTGTLLVTNPAANFGVIDGNANATRFLTVNMTNLATLKATVNRFAVGDTSLSKLQGVYNGAQMANFLLAKTNFITATFTDNYNNVDFNAAIQYQRCDTAINGAQAASFSMGISNVFLADSIALGHGGNVGSGTTAFANNAYPLKFAPVFTNPAAPFATAYFRNTDGVSRMSLLALGVDSGTTTSIANNRGFADFRGGIVNMLVDQIWLGQNRTNCSAKDDQGGLFFERGVVNANTIIAGNMKYTNIASSIIGYISVGTNGTLYVNNNLILGQTPAAVTGFENQAAAVSGQLQINNGGTISASQITVGRFSTNNNITLNTGGSLIVTNAIASVTNSLSTMTLGAGKLTFFVQGGVTNAFVTNLVTSATCTINIAAVSGFTSYPATNVLIAYQTAGAHNFGIGSLPPGFNNLQIVDDPIGMTINLIINTNQPKNLAWRGGENSQWDHSSLNWLDSGAMMTTKFTDGDIVTFDDTAAVPTSISIAENVNPSQSGTGIFVNNTNNQFTFNNSGGGTVGSCVLVKTGTNNLEIDCPSTIAPQITAGSLTGSGSISSTKISAGAVYNFDGTDVGTLTTSGTTTITPSGVVSANLIINGGMVTNNGTVNGPLTMSAGAFLYNAGTLSAIGSASVATNSTLINNGAIYGTTLTVDLGGKLMDTTSGYVGVTGVGGLNVATLIINGTFIPGGDVIGITRVTDYLFSGTQAGNPAGRIQLNSGSTTIFKVDMANPQTNTLLLSQNQGFGPSQANKAINGGTIVITNIGALPFADGQTFKLFGNYFNNANIGNGGLNTTNSYPIIKPAVPGPGLVWDLSQLIPGGYIAVVDPSSIQIPLTSSILTSPTNVITEFSWPANYTGGWLQQLNTTLTNGLQATNWITVAGSSSVNDIFVTNNIIANPTAAGSAIFFRFVYP